MWEIEYQGKLIRGGFKTEGNFVVFEWGHGNRIKIRLEEWERLRKKRV